MGATNPIDIAAAHRERIGCSLIAQALGLSPFGTAYDLWAQYTGKAEWPDIGDELRVALGEPMEDVLRPFVAARLGRELRRDRREYLHPELPLIGHVDYRTSRVDGEAHRPVVDMKTSLGFGAKNRFGEDGTDQVDDGVLLQMQGYLMLTGAETAYVAALVPGPELKIYTISSDKEMHELIAAGIYQFWQCVQTDIPPDPHDEAEARQRWTKHTVGRCIEADAEMADAARELAEINREMKRIEGKKIELRNKLVPYLADGETLTWEGKPLLTYKSNKDGQETDWEAIALELSADATLIAKHTKTTPGARVLRLAKGL